MAKRFRPGRCAAILAFTCTLGSVGMPAFAQVDSKAPIVNSPGATSADARFMRNAIEIELSEVELGNIAIQRAANDDVREFAQRVVKDHDHAKNDLTKLAAKKGISLPTEMTAAHTKLREHLAKLSGSDFDRAYMKAMVQDHEKALRLFQTEAQRGEEPDVKDWANKELKSLNEHLRAAKNVDSRLVIGKTRS